MWQTIGHAWAVQHLTRAIANKRLAHANLLTGPANIGKSYLARELAAALTCRDEDSPCGSCRHCTRIQADIHPDVLFVEPEDATLKIDQIRRIQYELSLRPVEGPRRICILTQFETSTTEAANALLKTLEEPPTHATLVLTALDASLLLPTIVSRCRVLPLRPVPPQTITDALVNHYQADPIEAEEIALLSGGRIGWAISAILDRSLTEERRQDVEALLELVPQGRAARIKLAETIAKRDDVHGTIYTWQTVWRDMMFVSAGCEELAVNRAHLERLRELAANIKIEQSSRAAARAQEAIDQIDHNVNPRLAVEAMLLSWNHQ